jgi:hypothetical protein
MEISKEQLIQAALFRCKLFELVLHTKGTDGTIKQAFCDIADLMEQHGLPNRYSSYDSFRQCLKRWRGQGRGGKVGVNVKV